MLEEDPGAECTRHCQEVSTTAKSIDRVVATLAKVHKAKKLIANPREFKLLGAQTRDSAVMRAGF